MSTADLDVARMLASHPRWQWRAGTLIAGGYRLDAADEAHGHVDGVPDLRDDATAGVLLGMLGEALEVVSVGREDGIWAALMDLSVTREPTLGVAAARALLAVWGAP